MSNCQPGVQKAANTGPKTNRVAVMAMLLLAYTFNFIDRQIVGILAIPIKADLGLSDAELGLMGGLAFALFYTSLGIPVAMLADRFNRSWIMTGALFVWSLMTAVCGLAQNFWQLFAARLGVGVGEAGGVAPAYSLISDYYPQHERARALSIYSIGIPVGSALGIVAGAYIATEINWRVAFFAVGIAGLVLAPLFKLVVKEPPRGQFDAGAKHGEKAPSVVDVFREIAGKPTFWGLSVGAACSSMMGYGLFFWLPSFLVRSFEISVLDAGLSYGALLFVGGSIGIYAGGFLADRYGQANKALYARIPAIAFVATIPFYLMGILSTNLLFAMLVLVVPTALGLAWLGPILTAIQHLVPANMRATASAMFLFINNLLGIGLGTALLGYLSDILQSNFGEESLRYSILAGTGFYVVAAVLFFLSSRTLARDWYQPAEAAGQATNG